MENTEETTKTEETKTEEKVIDPDAKVKELASAIGWVDKENYKGDPDEYVGPEEYIKRQKIFTDSIKNQNKSLLRTLREAKQTIEIMTKRDMQKIEREVDTRVKELKQQRKAAIKDDDEVAADAIDKQIDELLDEHRSIKKGTETQKNDAFEDFVEENPWYGKDDELTAYADSVGIALDKTGKYTQEEIYEIVKEKVSKVIDIRNLEKKKPQKEEEEEEITKVSDVGSGTNRRRTGGKKKPTFADLTPDQQQVANTLKSQGVMTHEQYIDDLIKRGYFEN